VQRAVRPLAVLPGLPAGARVWDLCGIGRLPTPRDAKALADDGMRQMPDHLGAEPAGAAFVAMAMTLSQGPPRARAAFLLLTGIVAEGRDPKAELSALSAAGADDPVLAMWTTASCHHDAGCDDAALSRWVALEPTNAAAWLLWLERFPERRAEALQHLAEATHFSTHDDALLAAALAAWPRGVPAYLEPAMWIYVIGVQAAQTVSQFGLAGRLCQPAKGPDGGVQPLCSHIATLMAEHSDSTLARAIAARLGERAGWPAERVKAAQERSRAEQAAPPWLDPAQPLSCASIEPLRQTLQARAQAETRGPR
jgi:hypothetical protein